MAGTDQDGLQVQDLHSITPAAYVEFGEAVVHEAFLPAGATFQHAGAPASISPIPVTYLAPLRYRGAL